LNGQDIRKLNPRKVDIMKRISTKLIALALFSTLSMTFGVAQAGPLGMGVPSAYANHSIAVRGGFHGGHGWGGGHGHRGYGGGWVAPLLGAAIVGGAIYSTLPPASVVIQQPPVIVPQQQVITDPSRVSYYCPAYQQYYPNVTQCPSAWQVVPY
jgi:hypothetical protein